MRPYCRAGPLLAVLVDACDARSFYCVAVGMAKRHQEDVEDRGYHDDDRAACLAHFEGDDLLRTVKAEVTELSCDFCEKESADGVSPIAVSLEVIAATIINAVRRVYERAIDVLYNDDDFTTRYDTFEAVQELAGYDLDVEVLEALRETFVDELWCEEPSGLTHDVLLMSSWETLRRQVMHHQRFVFMTRLAPEMDSLHGYTLSATALLESLGRAVEQTGILRTLPEGSQFFRGRPSPIGTKSSILGAKDLGSPPVAKAAANRMSPAGISMFYGTEDLPTVLSELSAHHGGGSSEAQVGTFRALRNLVVVDLTSIPPIRVFDGKLDFRVVRFLQHFAQDLSRPVALDGSEHIEYVPTQVATEYLRFALGVDGIKFDSSLTGGANVVLFVSPDGCCDQGEPREGAVLELVSGSVAGHPIPAATSV